MTQHIKLLIALILFPFTAIAQDQIAIDLSTDWLRRDWDKCEENVTGIYQDNAFKIQSDHAAALFWQVPTKEGEALEIDRDQSWIRKCKRPPMDFEKNIQKGNTDRLISIKDYPYISWQWRVSNTIDDTNTSDDEGEILKDGDDFAAKIGISILTDKGKLHEVTYLWTRTIPEETVLTQKTTVVRWILEFDWYRIVAQSGDEHLNTWINEKRNIYRDFKRLYPKEEPSKIARIYLMSDSDNTGSTSSAAFSDLIFHKNPPSGYVQNK
ncbi:MAG: DUF3047 domain-containing protein [Candidatus Latescibacteria bacterium]|nr:DUF3047 domain-containing protein [Candidatus Latescibacterota bacterium]